MIDPIKIRNKFQIYKKNSDLVYLDSSASALKVDDAIFAARDFYDNYGVNVHRGAYELSYYATKAYEDARIKASKFINAFDNEIVFTKGTTQSLNIVANGYLNKLTSDDEIIVSELEHHSSLVPWINVSKKTGAKLIYIPLTKEGRITLDNFKKVLTKKTSVIAITLASNVLGYVTPAKDIIDYAKSLNKDVITILDAAQAAPNMKIDVKDLNVDYLAFSGHKMYAPFGVGVLYGKNNKLNELDPFEFGGEMVLEVSKHDVTFKDAPYKFEAGTPVIAGAIGLASAIDFINDLGIDNINEHTKALRDYTYNQIKDFEGLTIYNKDTDLSIITFNVDNIHPHDIASYLDQYHVALRAGVHCAQLVAEFLNTKATLRASFNVYNNQTDCDTFIKALKAAIDFFKKF